MRVNNFCVCYAVILEYDGTKLHTNRPWCQEIRCLNVLHAEEKDLECIKANNVLLKKKNVDQKTAIQHTHILPHTHVLLTQTTLHSNIQLFISYILLRAYHEYTHTIYKYYLHLFVRFLTPRNKLHIYTESCTNITEVNLSEFVYRLFHGDVSPLIRTTWRFHEHFSPLIRNVERNLHQTSCKQIQIN